MKMCQFDQIKTTFKSRVGGVCKGREDEDDVKFHDDSLACCRTNTDWRSGVVATCCKLSANY